MVGRLVWFSEEEARVIEVDFEADWLRRGDPEFRRLVQIVEEYNLPDEFLESWR